MRSLAASAPPFRRPTTARESPTLADHNLEPCISTATPVEPLTDEAIDESRSWRSAFSKAYTSASDGPSGAWSFCGSSSRRSGTLSMRNSETCSPFEPWPSYTQKSAI